MGEIRDYNIEEFNMFKGMKVATRLIAGFLFVSVLGALVAAIGIGNMSRINDQADTMYERELLGLSYIKEANIDLIYVGRGLRSVLLASTEAERKDLVQGVEKSRQAIKGNIEKAKPLFVSEHGKQLFSEVDRALAEYDGTVVELLKRAQGEQLQASRDIVQYLSVTAAPKAQAADDKLTQLSKAKEKNAEAESVETARLYETSRSLMIGLVVASTLAGLALGMLITRSVTRPLAKAVSVAEAVASGDLTTEIQVTSSDETGKLMQALKSMNDNLSTIVGKVRVGTDTIATASGQIASGNQDLSQRTEEQAASLEETAASMEELTGTVKQNAENAQQANQLAQSSSQVAIKGGEVVGRVVETMSSINQSSRKIVDIISVIDGIAFQTNILALNAAVEAARAGEQGRGFAVVASEVRSLAQRSAAAAKEIKSLIDDSVSKVDVGSELVGQAGQTMQEIVGSIKRVTDIMGEIAAASQEQTRGIEQVNQAITQMDQVTQQNAALVEEASAAAQSMREQAGALVQAASVFKVDGAATARHLPAAQTAVEAPSRPARVAAPPVVRKLAAPAKNATPSDPRREAAAAGTGKAEWTEF